MTGERSERPGDGANDSHVVVTVYVCVRAQVSDGTFPRQLTGLRHHNLVLDLKE